MIGMEDVVSLLSHSSTRLHLVCCNVAASATVTVSDMCVEGGADRHKKGRLKGMESTAHDSEVIERAASHASSA